MIYALMDILIIGKKPPKYYIILFPGNIDLVISLKLYDHRVYNAAACLQVSSLN